MKHKHGIFCFFYNAVAFYDRTNGLDDTSKKKDKIGHMD